MFLTVAQVSYPKPLITIGRPQVSINTACVIRGSSPKKIAWDLLMMVFVFYNSVSVPFLASLDPENELMALEIVEFVLDGLFAIDIGLSFRTSFVDHNGDEIVEPSHIARHYGYSYKFPLDFVTVIPLETILVLFYSDLQSRRQTTC